MNIKPKSKESRSEKVYRSLLILYPQKHRQKFGRLMTQLFRDQLKDAWLKSGWLGVATLWIRVVMDLLTTAATERLESMNKRKSMNQRIQRLFNPDLKPAAVFLRVFTVVFLLILVVSILVTLLLPKSYSSTARLILSSPTNTTINFYDPYFEQNEFEVIQSDVILGKVVENLKLQEDWSRKYSGGKNLSKSEATSLLRNMLQLRPVRGTTLVDIKVFSQDAKEASVLANGIADVYRSSRISEVEMPPRLRALRLVEKAVPSIRPVRPNVPLNLLIGSMAGSVMAAISGFLVLTSLRLFRKRQQLQSIKV